MASINSKATRCQASHVNSHAFAFVQLKKLTLEGLPLAHAMPAQARARVERDSRVSDGASEANHLFWLDVIPVNVVPFLDVGLQ